MSLTSFGINTTHQSFQMMYITFFQLKGLKSYQPSKFNVSVFLSKADFSSVTFEPLELEQSYIHHLKALMCGINASRGQGHGCRFTMYRASLNTTLLLHCKCLQTICRKKSVKFSLHFFFSSFYILFLLFLHFSLEVQKYFCNNHMQLWVDF